MELSMIPKEQALFRGYRDWVGCGRIHARVWKAYSFDSRTEYKTW